MSQKINSIFFKGFFQLNGMQSKKKNDNGNSNQASLKIISIALLDEKIHKEITGIGSRGGPVARRKMEEAVVQIN